MLPEKILIVLFKRSKYLHQFTRLNSDVGKGRTVLFFEPKVQALLKKLTNIDLETAFPVRKTGERLKPPEYKFMTDAELLKSIQDARTRCEKWQQMPPVLDARSEEGDVICKDAALDGYDQDGSSLIFTDITYGTPDQERLIVVREPDGTLKHASWDQRHRMTETYSPRPGRELTAPPMFHGEYFESLLDRREYKFVLDRACTQYEPDDPDYIRVTSATYDRVAREKHFRYLHGTRHFGPLLFYLVFKKQVDTLLLENLQNDKIEDTVSLVHLYHMVHPDAASATSGSSDGVELVKAFISQDVARQSVLELALKTCLERLHEKKVQADAVEKAHGVKHA